MSTLVPINLDGDKSEKGGGNYQIKRMMPRHFRMIDLHVAGLSNVDIAKTLECTPQSVGIVLRSPIVRKEIQRQLSIKSDGSIEQDLDAFASRALAALEESSEKAANTQIDLLESDDDSVKLRASSSILDRVLGKPEPQHASEGAHIKIEINTQDAQLLMVALQESKEISSHAKDTQPTADGQDASRSVPGQGNVHQASIPGAGVGHRQAEAQDSEVEIKKLKLLSQSQLGNSSTVDPEGNSTL